MEILIQLVEGLLLVGLFGLCVLFLYIKDFKYFFITIAIIITYSLFLLNQESIAMFFLSHIKGGQ